MSKRIRPEDEGKIRVGVTDRTVNIIVPEGHAMYGAAVHNGVSASFYSDHGRQVVNLAADGGPGSRKSTPKPRSKKGPTELNVLITIKTTTVPGVQLFGIWETMALEEWDSGHDYALLRVPAPHEREIPKQTKRGKIPKDERQQDLDFRLKPDKPKRRKSARKLKDEPGKQEEPAEVYQTHKLDKTHIGALSFHTNSINDLMYVLGDQVQLKQRNGRLLVRLPDGTTIGG